MIPNKTRKSPSIPDHEVLRKIGGGAYGEVWLARGVTGALRAVKVVWREDFEEERGFEREFEGILKFEPISRDHPGLVHILHVGRSPDENSFYYYVMELGDDVTRGREIHPVEYEPRTLRADNQQAKGLRWDTADCIEIGIRLAEALQHLHDSGLAHRDVKPSNIIFVNGKAKLADIGLVAARGQRTFVGTEGFVPPEGPGSAQADIYSLGKVLYEIATGNDRMNFPELPDDMPTGGDRKRWLELNRVICDVCEPRISKRNILEASELSEALKRIQRGRSRRGSRKAVWATSAMLLSFSAWVGWEVTKDAPWMQALIHPDGSSTTAPTSGLVRIISSPEGADVVDEMGRVIGTTPTPLLTARVGQTLSLQLRKRGYRDLTISEVIPASSVLEPHVIPRPLEVFSPPEVGEIWRDQYGTAFLPIEDHHESAEFITQPPWELFLQSPEAPQDRHEMVSTLLQGQPAQVVVAEPNAATAFCHWFRQTGIKAGFLTDDHEVLPMGDGSFTHHSLSPRAQEQAYQPFRVKVRKVNYAHLTLRTLPDGALIYLNGQAAPPPHNAASYRVKPGKIKLLLLLDGYQPLTHSLELHENESRSLTLTMEKNQSVVFGKPWENSLGMSFVPLNEDLMVSIWETRRSDYDVFIRESGHTPAAPPPFEQGDHHPVVNVSRDDARAFCAWLTEKERASGRITQSHQYRLPTDWEWSLMADVREDALLSPAARDKQKAERFPWGGLTLDPSQIVGNYADLSLAATPEAPPERTIPGYRDPFPFTSPVGSFSKNSRGIYDLGGNVQEWMEDDYSRLASEPLGVLRGGGWNTWQTENLYTGARNAQPPEFKDSFYGFRIALTRVLTESK